MGRRLAVWGLPGLLYLSFFAWYTSFAGPLTPDEIESYLARMEANGIPAEGIATLRAFMESDTGGDFLMLNAIDLRDAPRRIGEVGPDETSQQVLDRYMAHMYPELFRRACHPVFFGPAVARVMDLEGITGAEDWTHGGLVRYRSRRDLLEIASNPAFHGPHEYKIAAMEKTIAYPVEPMLNLGEPRLLLGLLLLVIAMALELLTGRRSA